MKLKHLAKEIKYYNNLEGSVKRMTTKFVLAKTPLRKWVNTKSYSKVYGNMIKKKSSRINPIYIQIENTNLCNAKCIMCPHTTMKRKKKTMNQKDFEKIVNNIMKNYSSIKTLTITGFGEPLMDKEIIEKIKFINNSYPNLDIDIYTNASMLDKEMAEKLLQTKLHKINFSVNGTENTYKTMMGLDYEKTVSNILYFLEKRKEMKKKFPLINISLMIVKENEENIETFQRYWMDKVDSVMIYLPSNWAGTHNINYASSNPFKDKRWTCRVLWDYLTVDVDGNLIMCCRDYESKVKFGNLLKQDAKEIFEGKILKEIREKQINNDFSMPICSNCDNSFDSSLNWWR